VQDRTCLALMSCLLFGMSACGGQNVDLFLAPVDETANGSSESGAAESAAPGTAECASEDLTTYKAPGSSTPELHVVGIYESRSDHTFSFRPQGEASVHVTRPGSVVVGVTSYEPTRWTITAAPDTKILSVIALGYHAQELSVPIGAEVSIHTYDQGDSVVGCAYVWPSDDQGCDTPGTVAAMEEKSGLSLNSFQGCYTGTSFVVGGEPAAAPSP
jgi:hypothetical protein